MRSRSLVPAVTDPPGAELHFAPRTRRGCTPSVTGLGILRLSNDDPPAPVGRTLQAAAAACGRRPVCVGWKFTLSQNMVSDQAKVHPQDARSTTVWPTLSDCGFTDITYETTLLATLMAAAGCLRRIVDFCQFCFVLHRYGSGMSDSETHPALWHLAWHYHERE